MRELHMDQRRVEIGRRKVGGTLWGLSCVILFLLCASPHSLWALLQPIPTPPALPDTNIIPLWYSKARSSGQGACLTSRLFLFHCWEEGEGGRQLWQDRAPRSTQGWRPSGLQRRKSWNGIYHPQPGLVSSPQQTQRQQAPTISQPGQPRPPQNSRPHGPRPNWAD